MAPEIVANNQPYDCKVDVWSAGVIAYILLSGRPPFKGKTRDEIFAVIRNSKVEFPPAHWVKVSKDAKDFIFQALTKDPTLRPTAETLLQH
jgi:serine/threonine protein kinase